MRELIAGLSGGQVMIDKWIPVSERLPESGKEVLVWNGSIWKSLYRIPEKENFPIRWEWLPWRNNYATYILDVTHWQPLPEPPEVCDVQLWKS